MDTTNTILASKYDRLLRTASKELRTEDNKTYKTEYQYKDINSTRTTTQIKSMKNGADQALNYTYDKNGNIETISSGTELKHKYYYDALNQLVREDDKDRNVTIVYTYDVGGNIYYKDINIIQFNSAIYTKKTNEKLVFSIIFTLLFFVVLILIK